MTLNNEQRNQISKIIQNIWRCHDVNILANSYHDLIVFGFLFVLIFVRMMLEMLEIYSGTYS